MMAGTFGMRRDAAIGLAASFGLSALVLMVAGKGSPIAAVPVAICAGIVVGLGNRLWMLITGCALLSWAIGHDPGRFDPANWAISLALLAAGALPLQQRPLRLPWIGWAAMPLGASVAMLVAILASHSVIRAVMTLAASGIAGLASLLLVRMIAAGGPVASPGGAATSAQALSTARYLLVGRIAGGLFHELSQPLNVIMMANDNLSYIINRLDIAPREREQMAARVGRIAAHSDVAAATLGLLRWFGRDGSRDQGTMSVGTALERAIAATHPEARTAGVTIEVRGDALDYPALVRHGTVEMIAVAALLDLFGGLSGNVADTMGGRVVLEASHRADEIIVSLLCEQLPSELRARSDIDHAMFDLADGFARDCGGGFMRVSRRNDPVQLAIRLNRAFI